jgi:hypothetical protein
MGMSFGPLCVLERKKRKKQILILSPTFMLHIHQRVRSKKFFLKKVFIAESGERVGKGLRSKKGETAQEVCDRVRRMKVETGVRLAEVGCKVARMAKVAGVVKV